MAELLGGFAATIANPLVAFLPFVSALLCRRAAMVRHLTIAAAVLLAWIEARPLVSMTALAACLGAAAGGLLLAELWLSVLLPAARAGRHLLSLIAAELLPPRAPPPRPPPGKRD